MRLVSKDVEELWKGGWTYVFMQVTNEGSMSAVSSRPKMLLAPLLMEIEQHLPALATATKLETARTTVVNETMFAIFGTLKKVRKMLLIEEVEEGSSCFDCLIVVLR